MDNKKIISTLLFVAFLIFSSYAGTAGGAAISSPKKEVQLCLACHADNTLKKKLMDKEILSLYINSNDFDASVHGRTGCTGCHPDITMQNHPRVKMIASRREYVARLSGNCSVCHTPEQLKKRQPIHSSLASQGTCVQCHGSHYIKPVAAAKAGVKENVYCLVCHRNNIGTSMKNGESLSAFVNEAVLKSSVHGSLKCTECHTEFSKTRHPIRSFGSRRVYSIDLAELCRKCHSETFKRYEVSIHFEKLKTGDLKSPACTDCHGAHSVARTKEDKAIGLRSCNNCHGNMDSSYEASVHGRARAKGNEKAPVCSSCHNAHDVRFTAMTTRIKENCLKCHKDAGKLHNKWLSNPPITLPSFAQTHFDVVACAACHSAGSERAVYLSLFNSKTGKPLAEAELAKIMDTDPQGLASKIDENGDGIIDAKEMWDLFAYLYKKGASPIFIGKIDVRTATEAHMIDAKAEAVKDCDKCHSPRADFFKDNFVVIKKDGDKLSLLKAKSEVLNSIYTILPVRKFYALGSTSMKLLDILFIIALIGGIAVPIGHMSLRIITSPLRALRRMGKGGKK
jgi:predicted CXXCH cytochrome family protein